MNPKNSGKDASEKNSEILNHFIPLDKISGKVYCFSVYSGDNELKTLEYEKYSSVTINGALYYKIEKFNSDFQLNEVYLVYPEGGRLLLKEIYFRDGSQLIPVKIDPENPVLYLFPEIQESDGEKTEISGYSLSYSKYNGQLKMNADIETRIRLFFLGFGEDFWKSVRLNVCMFRKEESIAVFFENGDMGSLVLKKTVFFAENIGKIKEITEMENSILISGLTEILTENEWNVMIQGEK